MQNILILISFFVWVGCGENDSSSTSAVDNTLTVTGVLQISPQVAPPSGIEAGEVIEGAQVFMREFPDQVVETDEAGAFVLNVQLDNPTATTSLLSSSYEVFMWYTVDNPGGDLSSVRLGASESVTGVAGATVDLDTVSLAYTTGLHLFLYNSSNQSEALLGCEVSVTGLSSQLLTAEIGNGRYDVDYLPDSQYQLVLSCDGYQEKTETVTVAVGDNIDDWDTYTYYLDPL